MNRLRVLRAERRWSQADLADRLGVSRQTVNAIEPQSVTPRADVIAVRVVARGVAEITIR